MDLISAIAGAGQAIVGTGVQGITDIQSGINTLVNGKPKIAAAVKFIDALSSYNSDAVAATITNDAQWTTYPKSANTPVQKKAEIINPGIWKGIKNFTMFHVAVPFEAEGDRVVMHTQVGPQATTPGGIPCTNEMFWVVTLKPVPGQYNKWLVGDIIEMLDTVSRANWLADWNKEKAAAAGTTPVVPPTPDNGGTTSGSGGPAEKATYAELLAAANRFVAAMQTYNVDTFTGTCHSKFVQKFFPYSLNIADRDRATCVAKLHDIWSIVDGIKIEILEGATLVDPTQNRVHMHCRAIAPGNGHYTGIHYRNEYTFVMDFAKEDGIWKVLIWREFVDSAGFTLFFTTELKAQADQAWTAAHPNGV